MPSTLLIMIWDVWAPGTNVSHDIYRAQSTDRERERVGGWFLGEGGELFMGS